MKSAKSDSGRPRQVAPNAWAASWIRGTPRRRASVSRASRSHGVPAQATHMMARVAGVSLRSTSAASIDAVSGSMSAHTTVPPRLSIGVFVATQVMGVVTTSLPGATPQSLRASVRALVHEFVSTSCLTPRNSATALWRADTCTPSLTKPDSSTVRSSARAASTSMWTLNMGYSVMCSVSRMRVLRSPRSGGRRSRRGCGRISRGLRGRSPDRPW